MKLRAIERLKIIKLLDYDNRIMPLKLTKHHAGLLDFVANSTRGVVNAFRGFGKSSIPHNIYTPSHCIFTQKDECIILVMNSHEKAKEWICNTREVIERAIRAGFKITKGDHWGAESFDLVNQFGKTISIGASSPKRDIRGTNKKFSRPTLVFCDDLESASPHAQINALTASGREKIEKYFFSDLLPALSDNARIIVLGTILHKEGLVNKLLNDSSFESLVIPAIIDNKSAWGEKMPLTKADADALRLKYPQRKDIESLEEIEKRLMLNGRIDDYYREYLCLPMADENKIFKREYIKFFDGVRYGSEIEVIEVKDALSNQSIVVKEVLGIEINGELVERKDFEAFLAIDNASSGRDATAMIVGAKYKGGLYLCEISGGVRWTPFQKCCELLKLTLEWKVSFGSEKGGVQNEFFYIYKDFIAKHRALFQKRRFYPDMKELSHGGKAKNVRIAQLEPLMRMGNFYINSKSHLKGKIIMQFMDFDMNADNTDDFIDCAAYFLQIFGFVVFQKKEAHKPLSANILFRKWNV